MQKGWRTPRVLIGLLAATALVCSGCDAPIVAPRVSVVDSLDVNAAVSPDGRANLRVRYSMTSSAVGGTTIRIGAAEPATVTRILADGNPAHVTGADTEVDIDGRRPKINIGLEDAVTRTSHAATLRLNLWIPNGQAARGDPLIDVDATIHLPHGSVVAADADTRSSIATLGLVGTRVDLDGDAVRIRGAGHPGRSVIVELTMEPDAFPRAAITPDTQVGSHRSERVLASAKRADTAYFDAAARTRRNREIIAAVYWILLALEVVAPLAVVAVRAMRSASRRRRVAAGVPFTLVEPPESPDADLAALVVAGGNRIEGASVAATMLTLIDRGTVQLDHVTSTDFRLRPSRTEADTGVTPAQAALVAELDRIAQGRVEGWVDAPIDIEPRGLWWRTYRRDIVRRAQAQRLIRRRFPPPVFVTSVIALLLTSAPLWGHDPNLAAGAVVIAMVLLALSALGGFSLADAGIRARAEWQAFGRHATEDLSLREASVPAITVWGPHLVAAAALGIAKPAIAELSCGPQARRGPAKHRSARLGDALFVTMLATVAAGSAAIVIATPTFAATAGTPNAGPRPGSPEPTCAVGSKADLRSQFTSTLTRTGPMDLACADLHGLSLIQRRLPEADLRHADLREVEFGQADLSRADFTGADLRGADLTQAELDHANFTQADLRGTVFGQAKLTGAVLQGAKARGAKFGQATMTLADLRGIDASSADFTQTDLSRVDASGGNFERADLTQATIRESDFTASRLRGADVGVSDAAGAVFGHADLTGAESLERLRTEGADLSGATGLPTSQTWPWVRSIAIIVAAAVVLGAIVLRSRALAQGR